MLKLRKKTGESNKDASARLSRILKSIEKETKGKTKLATFELPKAVSKDKAISTGFPLLDDLLSARLDEDTHQVVEGSGYGLPRGRIVEIYGHESSGKTTLALQLIAAAQKAGGIGAFVDAEHAFDSEYAAALGVDLDTLIFSQPYSGDEALEQTRHLAKKGVDIIVVDSVAALDPKSEQKKTSGDTVVGSQARLMSQACRQLAPICGKTGTTVIFLNQIRVKIVRFGDPETTSGGNALKFYASIRLKITKFKNLVKANVAFGSLAKLKTVKNKVAPALRTVTLKMEFGRGVVAVKPFKKDDKE